MKVLIVGTGLIGGSFALSIQRDPVSYELGGWDSSPAHLEDALKRNLVSKIFESLQSAIAWADAIILSVPISAIKELLPQLLDTIKDHQFVIDFGSTKLSICRAVEAHPRRNRFLAAHPISGTEYSGPQAAFASLYDEKVMIVCESQRTDDDVVTAFATMCGFSNMELVYMEAAEHDRHLAYISHLSHAASYSLSHVVLQKEKDGHVILELAGSGLASTVRLAKSSPEMWTPIFLDNRRPLLDGIAELRKSLETLEGLIEKGDDSAIFKFLEEGRKIRKILE